MILDTNALSAIADGQQEPLDRLAATSEAALPVIVLGEYRFGIAQSRRKKEYEEWLVNTVLRCRVLPLDEDTSIWYAIVRSELTAAGTPLPANDLWIAALSRQHGLPILSRDHHFDRVRGVHRVDW